MLVLTAKSLQTVPYCGCIEQGVAELALPPHSKQTSTDSVLQCYNAAMCYRLCVLMETDM